MRLDPIAPADLDDTERALHDEMAPVVAERLHGFSTRTDGALTGPFVPILHWPAWGRGVSAQIRGLVKTTVLPPPAHEVVVLVTGTGFRVAYELHAHERIAAAVGLAPAKIATIVAGQRPTDLDPAEAAAHDLAAALVRGGPVPDATWAAARDVLGEEGAAEVVFLVGAYSTVSVLLNGFGIQVLADERKQPSVPVDPESLRPLTSSTSTTTRRFCETSWFWRY